MRILIISILLLFLINLHAEIPLKRGVNLAGWLQKDSPGQIQFSKFTRDDFVNLKKLGFDHVRLPINLHAMTGDAPEYVIDDLFYFFLDQIIDWCEELNIYLILDNHTFDTHIDTDPDIDQILLPVWTQLAGHCHHRSDYVLYEVLNEPHGISDARWNEIQQQVVAAIRSVDQRHTIVIGPAGWNSFNNLEAMPLYADSNLIYTFHFYDPFLFTHQGASWTEPSMVPVADIPFPYDASRMPACPAELVGTWIAGAYSGYPDEGTISKVRKNIDIAVAFAEERNVQLLCGEFGVHMPTSPEGDRRIWYQIVRNYLENHKIAWTAWEYNGGFGFFEKGSNKLFDYDLNVRMLEALGLNVPEQKEFVLKPDSTGFYLYGDYYEKHIIENSWHSGGVLDYYSEANPAAGKFCIYWSGAARYNSIVFKFVPIKDLSQLLDEDYAVDMMLRVDATNASFDIRIVDTNTDDPADHPWRMRYIIDQNNAIMDGEWHRVQIPLHQFTEHGSWDNNTWYEPVGDFDWQAIDRFEIVAEHQTMEGIQIWFDRIRIIDPNSVGIEDKKIAPVSIHLYQNYPNPFNTETIIRFDVETLHATSLPPIKINICNILGEKIHTLFRGNAPAGVHEIHWDGRDASGRIVPGGVYFYRLEAGNFQQSRKMIFLK